jgi:hypothetical protein
MKPDRLEEFVVFVIALTLVVGGIVAMGAALGGPLLAGAASLATGVAIIAMIIALGEE